MVGSSIASRRRYCRAVHRRSAPAASPPARLPRGVPIPAEVHPQAVCGDVLAILESMTMQIRRDGRNGASSLRLRGPVGHRGPGAARPRV